MTDVTITTGMRRAIVGLLLLTLIVGGGNLWATVDVNNATKAAEARQAAAQLRQAEREQAEQRRQGEQVEHKICLTVGQIAELKPPAGNPLTNPSRSFEQGLHRKLDELGPDLRCGKAGS